MSKSKERDSQEAKIAAGPDEEVVYVADEGDGEPTYPRLVRVIHRKPRPKKSRVKFFSLYPY